MLQVTPRTKIFLAVKPVDFRNGIEGLAAICRYHFAQDPFSGNLFIFRNKRGTSIVSFRRLSLDLNYLITIRNSRKNSFCR